MNRLPSLPSTIQHGVETEILNTHGANIGAALRDVTAIVEFGSGSSTKTEILLRHMKDLRSYVAIDVSPSALRDAKRRLAKNFPALHLEALVADFSHVVQLPAHIQKFDKAGYFPGSTIGNFHPGDAVELLGTFAQTLGNARRLVIGVDLYKAPDVLNRAYNDARGVTAEFNLNLLRRANMEADADFDLTAFKHQAAYDPKTGGVDMYLVSTKRQTVTVDGQPIHFREGEKIHTEHSHKYKREEFASVAKQSGWRVARHWTDPDEMFAVFDLVAA